MPFDTFHRVALPPNVHHGESSQGDLDRGDGGVPHEGGGGDTNLIFRDQLSSGNLGTFSAPRSSKYGK